MTDKCKRGQCPNRAWKWGHGYCAKHARVLAAIDGHGRIPADRIREHLKAVVAAGGIPSRIDEGCQVSNGVTLRIIRGQRTVQASVAQRLEAATPEMGLARPAWPICRRVRALRAAGWGIPKLAEAWGMSVASVENLCREDRKYVHKATDRVIRDFYTAHECDPLRTPTARTAAHLWATPWDWDDIDNPHELRYKLKATA